MNRRDLALWILLVTASVAMGALFGWSFLQ